MFRRRRDPGRQAAEIAVREIIVRDRDPVGRRRLALVVARHADAPDGNAFLAAAGEAVMDDGDVVGAASDENGDAAAERVEWNSRVHAG